MMKALHIVPTYAPAYSRGGPIWSVHNMNKWLVRKGVDVTVYTTDIDIKDKVPLGQEVLVDGVRVYYFRSSFPRIWEYWRVGLLPAFLPRHWEYSRDLHKTLIRNAGNFDLLHITSTFLFASTLGAYYAKKYKKPYIISPRGNLMEPLELKGERQKKIYIHLIEKNALRDAVIHCTVPKEQEHYERYKLPRRKFIVVPNGIDMEEFELTSSENDTVDFRKKYGIGAGDKIVLFLGRLNWKKGLDTLISAFKEVAQKNPRALLVLAGSDEGGYQKKVERWIDECGIKDRTLFTGELLKKDKVHALKESDVFLLTSYSENFGMAVVEAMYFGLPVVITNNVGTAPYVEKAGAGIVVPKKMESVAHAILEILENPNRKKEMGARGRQLVEREFVMSQIADRWVEAYKKLQS